MTEVLIARFGTTIVHRQDNTDAAPDMSNYQVKRLCQRQGDAWPIKNVSHDEVLLVKGLWLVLRATVAKALVPAVGSTHAFLSALSCC